MVAGLQARYQHRREQGAWQDERDLSDGTLRLIGLLWTLQDKASKSNRVILLEEPELSLHAAVVRKLPAALSRVTRRDGPQVILSTHSAEMLSDPGLGLDEVVVLSPDAEGTAAQMASEIEGAREHVDAGINLREILESRTQPAGIDQLPFFKRRSPSSASSRAGPISLRSCASWRRRACRGTVPHSCAVAISERVIGVSSSMSG